MQTIIAHYISYLYHINQFGIRIVGLFSTISFKIVSVVKDEHRWAYKNSNYREIFNSQMFTFKLEIAISVNILIKLMFI